MTGAIRKNNLSTSVRIKNPGLLILRHDRTCITCCLEIQLIKLMGKYDLNINCSFAIFILMLCKHCFFLKISPCFWKAYHTLSYLYIATYLVIQQMCVDPLLQIWLYADTRIIACTPLALKVWCSHYNSLGQIFRLPQTFFFSILKMAITSFLCYELTYVQGSFFFFFPDDLNWIAHNELVCM